MLVVPRPLVSLVVELCGSVLVVADFGCAQRPGAGAEVEEALREVEAPPPGGAPSTARAPRAPVVTS